jgi:outer membrane protein OmpA-like peptidoglycan-associated protein
VFSWIRRARRGRQARLAALLLALAAIAPAPAAVPAGAASAAPPMPSRAVRRELDRAQAQLRESILPRGAGAEVEILRDPERVVLRIPGRLLFDAESTIPRADAPARALLMAVRQLLHARTRLAGRIEIYTDGIGGLDANLQLSQRRADALLAWFTEEGIAAARLTTAARGASRPIASDDAPEGRMQNRRVELVFERPRAP